MKKKLIKLLESAMSKDLCIEMLGMCIHKDCASCPFGSEENKAKLIEELKGGEG